MAPVGGRAEHRRVSAPDPVASPGAVARPVFDRLLLTGAAGGLGRELRPRLRRLAQVLRVSDVAEMAAAGAGEEVMTAALQDAAAVDRIVAGSDAIVHLGGISTEGPFAPILEANIVGVWHLYEAARRYGVRRVVFASSNHVTGFYRQDEVIDPAAPMRPDGHYGLKIQAQRVSAARGSLRSAGTASRSVLIATLLLDRGGDLLQLVLVLGPGLRAVDALGARRLDPVLDQRRGALAHVGDERRAGIDDLHAGSLHRLEAAAVGGVPRAAGEPRQRFA